MCLQKGLWAQDKDTWIGTASHPLPFDVNFKPKPALFAMINKMLATTPQH